MKKLVLATIPWIVLSVGGQVFASVQLSAPQTKPGSYKDTQAEQAIGRIIVAPDGKFMLFEWGRPYLHWAPDVSDLGPHASRRLHTFLYRADIPVDEPGTTAYLFEPAGGTTYWLGELSPDSQLVSLFAMKLRDKRTRAGVWNLEERKVTWFEPEVDAERLNLRTLWLSNKRFVYPSAADKDAWIQADVITKSATACSDCSSVILDRARVSLKDQEAKAAALARQRVGSEGPQDAKLIAGSQGGELAVYLKDTPTTLALAYRRPPWPTQVLFENARPKESNAGWPEPPAPGVAQPWGPQESISTRYVGLHPSMPTSWIVGSKSAEQPMTPSPDGKYFFFLTHQGNLESDSTQVDLYVYKTEDVAAWLAKKPDGDNVFVPPPFRKLTRSSTSSRSEEPAIRDVRWKSDGAALTFLGMSEANTLQVHRLDLATGSVTQLSHVSQSVVDYETSGDGLMFTLHRPHPYSFPYPVTAVSRGTDNHLPRIWPQNRTVTYVSFDGSTERQLEGELELTRYPPVQLSPNGKYAIGAYSPPSPDLGDHRLALGPVQFVLVDLAKAQIRPIFGADLTGWIPNTTTNFRPQAFWAPDSSRVILVGTAIDASKDSAQASYYIVEYDPATGKSRPLESMYDTPPKDMSKPPRRYVSNFDWRAEGNELLVNHVVEGRPGVSSLYSFTSAGVRSKTAPFTEQQTLGSGQPNSQSGKGMHASSDGMSIGSISGRLVQDINTAPQLIVSDVAASAGSVAGHSANLLNAEVDDGVQFAQTRPFLWQDPDGKSVTAGLTLPNTFQSGKPVPLVIQAYAYRPDLYLPDGYNKTSDARQSLVSRGFAVLQIDFADPTIPAPGSRFVQRLDAVVDALVKAGIADRARIGLTGFSQGGYQTYYAIANPVRTKLAAAVSADSYKGHFESYVFFSAFEPPSSYDGSSWQNANAGGKPFWEAKEEWLKHDPSFNVDRVQTPVLLTSNELSAADYSGPYHSVRTVGAFVLNDKPADFLYFPGADHSLERPRERFAMAEALVDWLSFWIQAYEDPSPNKAKQYMHWRALKALQDKKATE